MIKLETERLCLRDYAEADFEAYYKLKTDDQTMYYLQDIKLDDRETARAEFSDVLADMESDHRKYYFLHMELKETHIVP